MNERKKIINNLIEIIKKIVRSNAVNSDSSTVNLPQWDSLSYMAIISEVEVVYHVSVTQDNIENFDLIQSIADIILSK